MGKIFGTKRDKVGITEPTYVFYYGNRYEVVPTWAVSGQANSNYQEVGAYTSATGTAYVYSVNKIDITKYSKLTVEFRHAFTGYDNGTVTFQVLNSADSAVKSVSNAFTRTGESGGGTLTFEIDISALSGNHGFRLVVAGQNSAGITYAFIRKIMLTV